MQVRWVRQALRNLEQAHSYYIAQDNPKAAIQLMLKIQAAVDRLVEFPLMGRVGRVAGTRELVIADSPYLVVYRVTQDTIEILRVLHAARKYPI